MKVLALALFLVSTAAVAADPATDPHAAARDSGTSARTAGSTPSNIEPAWSPKRQADAHADEDQWTTPTGVNYDTGEVCLARAAGGLCLEATDD